ncbi:WSC-domain-containing protein [Pleurotus eryngii]|uniref:WSC-domain-containing protein n=1 Tax=Pleurotus eryngii TaxID=5323 RepID=A0A9P5ZV70_PLEER|nr:WSC-domain-containing protein [Pleurotus eryngii]
MLYVRLVPVSRQAIKLTRSSSVSRGARTLNAASYTSSDSLTVESCLAFCAGKGFRLAGVEWNSECSTFSSTSISFVAYRCAVCDQAVQSPGAPTALSECSYPCSGDASQACGAGNRINIYAHGESPAPAVPQSVSMHWEYVGCYTDNVSSRTLSHIFQIPGGATIEFCLATRSMHGFAYAGLEFGDECFCGNTLGSSTKAADSQCTMACKGNIKQFCGGPDRLTLYNTGACQEQPPVEERP